MYLSRILVCLMLLNFDALANSNSVDFSGSVGLNQMYYWDDAQFFGQNNNNSLDVIFEPEITWNINDNQSFYFEAYTRLGSQDDQLQHTDIREFHWSYQHDKYNLTIGLNKIFWGVVESLHLVDVINQTDLVESFDQEEKLGQPMVNLNMDRDWGTMALFWLPYFRERTFSGERGRLRPSVYIDADDALYETSSKQKHQDFAIRYSHYIDDLDFGVYWFHGLNREPYFITNQVAMTEAADEKLIPVYFIMDQMGIDIQLTRDAWLWKLEAIAHDSEHERYFASVAGFEYNFYQIAQTDADLSFLTEYLYSDQTFPIKTLFNNDIFLGTRLALNNIQDTTFLLGAIVDADTQEAMINFQGESRLTADVFIEIDINFFVNTKQSLIAYEQDGHIDLKASWYF